MANSDAQLAIMSRYAANSKMSKFQSSARKHVNNLGLADLIILPVQRVPRYKLLLQEIVKRTDNRHPDYDGLQRALDLINRVNVDNNGFLKTLDAKMKVLAVESEMERAPSLSTPSRRYLFSGPLWKIKGNGKMERELFFLFNDCLVYATPKSFGKKCLFKMRIPIDAAFACKKVKNTKQYKNVFAVYSSLESFMVSTKGDEKLRVTWLEWLTKCVINARSGHYFHASAGSARMGRGSVLIAQAKLYIPKALKKELNRELALLHMPQTLGKTVKKKNMRFSEKMQHDLLTMAQTANQGAFVAHRSRRELNVDAADEKESSDLKPPPPPSDAIDSGQGLPKPERSFVDSGYASALETEEDEPVRTVRRTRSNSFGGSTARKSISEYHKKPHHHVPAHAHALPSPKRLRPKTKSANKLPSLPLSQSANVYAVQSDDEDAVSPPA